jgi:predicted nuclease of predicted toxin-antitoxin system
MRFLVDECTGPAVAQWLERLGHEVFSVFDDAQGSTDDEILSRAIDEGWILITNDKDFGEMIFRERRTHHGVVFLRLADERTANKIDVLNKILENYSDRLAAQFVTATENKIRFA